MAAIDNGDVLNQVFSSDQCSLVKGQACITLLIRKKIILNLVEV